MKNFTSALYVEMQRVKKEGPRKPLCTFTEMAEEFGVSRNTLGQYLWRQNGPQPVLKHLGSQAHRNVWYDPVVMRKWWKTVKRKA